MSFTWSITLCFVVIITSGIISSASSGKYEPIYFVEDFYEPHLIYGMEYDKSTNQMNTEKYSKRSISLTCPQNTHHNLLEKIETGYEKMVVNNRCERLIKSNVYTSKNPEQETSMVAFTVHMPKKKPSYEYFDVPQNYLALQLIEFKFEQSLGRTKFVKYAIAKNIGLRPKITIDPAEVGEYQKNIDIYGCDVDLLYSSQTAYSLSKVQLAPEEDFVYDNYKLATRQNIITAPMWSDLVPQWQALEAFIRKVTQIFDATVVKTGVHDILTRKVTNNDSNSSEKISLPNGKHPVPKYFWKALFSRRKQNNQLYQPGILFVLHNFDPDNSTNESPGEKICPDDDVSAAGWPLPAADDKIKIPIYACLYNEKNMSVFGEKPEAKFELFDLNNAYVLERDVQGVMKLKKTNILEEIRKQEDAVEKDVSQNPTP